MIAPGNDAEMLRMFLSGRDQPCPQCGYNLRDLTVTKCPECGEDLALRLQLSEPRQAAALAGLIALSAGAGMNGLLLGYVIIVVLFMKVNLGDLRNFVIVNLGGVIVLGICIFFWLKYWRQIRRLEIARRWMPVGACAAFSLADLILFAKLIR